ncbi:MAG: hypothetical protein HXY20_12380 [Acidobacteria bacterium]|nr:hypothetical protein [Acidobacteriota bacterium]
MKCEEVRPHLEDLCAGELESDLSGRVMEHAQACVECRRELDLLKAEDRLYRSYAAHLGCRLSNETALWGRVSARLRSGERAPSGMTGALRSFFSPRRVAYALVLVVLSVAGTLVTVGILQDSESRTASRISDDRDLESAMRSIARAEREYLEAIRLLSGIVEKRKPSLDPELVAELERNLKAIDENIAATRQAFREHPSDPELALYMLAAYAKKVEILQEIAS